MPPELPLRRPSEISISGRFVRTASRLDLSFLGARVYLLARIPSLRLVRTSRLCCASCLFIFPKGTTVTLPPSASSREGKFFHTALLYVHRCRARLVLQSIMFIDR
ncbi:hypothetical protein SETIT_1G230700v2 [Setaria italica]|uniref:Uncharacterized protein n=2 Tax=Setaria TaxID=4554 RepID=A0A368PNP3_SETIT|nr:hypothetical protein SETIT_1G230700v2 [Setaria italica]TKW40268.1 hypothetical protein SEVIR_1G234900v2 [Setaria viridis]